MWYVLPSSALFMVASFPLSDMNSLHSFLSNYDIAFFNFCHYQVWNFEISNLLERNWNFAVIFRKYWKQNGKSTKYFATSRKPSIIRLRFYEISLVSWNLVSYCRILQCLIKFRKSPKVLRKILLKWLGKTVKYQLNFINFHSCTEKWMTVGQLLAIT